MEMKCYRKILRISYKDHVTNEEVCGKDPGGNRTTQRPPDHRKETQTEVAWGRRRGRQKKKWEDSIREWTGLEFVESQMAVENREKWRKLV